MMTTIHSAKATPPKNAPNNATNNAANNATNNTANNAANHPTYNAAKNTTNNAANNAANNAPKTMPPNHASANPQIFKNRCKVKRKPFFGASFGTLFRALLGTSPPNPGQTGQPQVARRIKFFQPWPDEPGPARLSRPKSRGQTGWPSGSGQLGQPSRPDHLDYPSSPDGRLTGVLRPRPFPD